MVAALDIYNAKEPQGSALLLYSGVGNVGEFALDLQKEGWTVNSVCIPHAKSWKKWQILFFTVTKRPHHVIVQDLVVVYGKSFFLFAAIAVCRASGARLAIRHGNCAWIWTQKTRERLGWFNYAVTIWLLKMCNNLALSPSQQSDLFYVTGIRSRLISYNIRTAENFFLSSESVGPRHDQITFLNVASISRRKGTDLFVQIAKFVHQTLPEARFVWVGENISDFSRHNLVKDDSVEFFPWQNPKVFFQEASVFLCTSRSEAGGRAVVEALANGLPVVCFSGTGPAYFIEGSGAGLVLTSRDAKSAASELVAFVGASKEVMAQRRQAAHNVYASKFRHPAATQQLITALREDSPAFETSW